jgi:ATP-dependent Zn protease
MLSLDNAVAGKRAGIVVIGATNNINGVDAALLRPGRLERAIEIKRPDRAGALNILRYHLNGTLLEADLSEIADLMEGSTGAEIMMAVRSARRAARYQGRELECDDLLKAIAPIENIAPHVLRRICIHEAAHAVSSLAVHSGILKRCFVGGTDSSSAGETVIRRDNHDFPTKNEIERQVIVALCGRVAEEVLIGDISSGAGGDAKSDLARSTRLIAALHASWGLGGTVTYIAAEEEVLAAVVVDRNLRTTVEKHLQELQLRARELVIRYRDAILAVSDQLQQRRQLSGEEVKRIVDATPARIHASERRPQVNTAHNPMHGHGGRDDSDGREGFRDNAPADLECSS